MHLFIIELRCNPHC